MHNIRTIAQAMPEPLEKRILIALAAIAIFFLVAYVYLINQTVWNIVTRKNLTKEITEVSGQVAALESSYMTLSSSVTIDRAYALGFSEVDSSKTTFVNRPTLGIR